VILVNKRQKVFILAFVNVLIIRDIEVINCIIIYSMKNLTSLKFKYLHSVSLSLI